MAWSGRLLRLGPIKDGPGGSRTYGMWKAALTFPTAATVCTFLGVVLWLAAVWVILRLRRR